MLHYLRYDTLRDLIRAAAGDSYPDDAIDLLIDNLNPEPDDGLMHILQCGRTYQSFEDMMEGEGTESQYTDWLAGKPDNEDNRADFIATEFSENLNCLSRDDGGEFIAIVYEPRC